MSVVVPVFDVESLLPAALDSLLAQDAGRLDVVVVDDGSTDGSGGVADAYAARDPRVRVVHTPNRGLGAARNEGIRHARGEFLAFLDSDDVLPPGAYGAMLDTLSATGSDFVSASFLRWERGEYDEPRWMRRLHAQRRTGIRIDDHPELLGDVFAWDKLFRRRFWDEARLSWPEGVRYEDQPTSTAAFLRGRFDVLPDHVCHWRIRSDGTSLTQQRATVADLRDRMETKRTSLALVRAEGSPAVQEVFVDRVLPGDLWRYFELIPTADDEWWRLLRDGVGELWADRSLVHSILPPVHRLTGWLVEQDRRADAVTVIDCLRSRAGGLPRVVGSDGLPRVDVPGVDADSVDPAALALRPEER